MPLTTSNFWNTQKRNDIVESDVDRNTAASGSSEDGSGDVSHGERTPAAAARPSAATATSEDVQVQHGAGASRVKP